jgi:RecB family endonuclease NucS
MSAAALPAGVTDDVDEPPAAESLSTLTDPAPERAVGAARAALSAEAVLTILGRCTVDYDGRASSTLGPGDRIVVCKPDGAVLVHTDEGREPVNWQPPGSEQSVAVTDGALHLHSERTSPDERLSVTFRRVDHLVAYRAVDEEELSLSGTEADLRERLLADPDLVEPGFSPRATERDTAAGAVDLYGEDADGRPVAVELKRRRVGPDAVGQLNRYVDALDRELHADAEVRGVLVAPSVTDRARELLAERGLGFVSVEPDPDSGE